MAITLPKENTRDNDNNKFIGIKLPLGKSDGAEGYFTSTEITIDAVKENIRNLLRTRQGERVFQPSIGTPLDNFLFENIDDDMISMIDEEIRSTFSRWMPFITIARLDVGNVNNENKLNLNMKFFLNRNPNILESIQIDFG